VLLWVIVAGRSRAIIMLWNQEPFPVLWNNLNDNHTCCLISGQNSPVSPAPNPLVRYQPSCILKPSSPLVFRICIKF
jgi:hypothetical protein